GPASRSRLALGALGAGAGFRAGSGLGPRAALLAAVALGARPEGLTLDGGEALFERGHQVRRLGRLRLLGHRLDDLLATRLDLDRLGLLRVELLELLTRHDDVLLGRDLVALDDVLVRDLLAVGLGDPLVPDAGAVARPQLTEAHGLPRHGAVQPHGHVQEPEADRSCPDCASHLVFSFPT